MPGRVHRLRGVLAGTDGPGRRALPAGELLHPIPLAAVLVLVLNDWWWKHGALPPIVTGKLSDVAGLASFPLLVTAGLDLALYGLFRMGLAVDFTLRRWKLVVAIGLTGALFAWLKLDPRAAAALAGGLRGLGLDARIVADPSDVLALPALIVPLVVGWGELRRVPLGRLEWIACGPREPGLALADVAAAGADPAAVAELAGALREAHDPAVSADRVARALAQLRG